MTDDPHSPHDDADQKEREARGGLLNFLLAPLAMLGLVSVTASPEMARRHPWAKVVGLLTVPVIFGAVALYLWADSQGYVRDVRMGMGLTAGYIDVASGNVCEDHDGVYDASVGRATAELQFYDDGRTELTLYQRDGENALDLTLVFQADARATLDDDILSAVQFAFVAWTVSDSDVAQGGLTNEGYWSGPTPPMNDIAQIRAEDMSQYDLDGVDLRVGIIEANKGDGWLTVPVVFWREGAPGARTYSVSGRVPDDEMADAIRLFSSPNAGKAALRLSFGDQTRRVVQREMAAADMGGVMRAAIDDMLAQWQAGLPDSC